MEITFKSKYKSIETFNKIENAPDFMVILGKNGSGKTHLLGSIEAGDVCIDDTATDEILYFNYQSFMIQSQKDIIVSDLNAEKDRAWNQLNNSMKREADSFDKGIKAIVVGDCDNPYKQQVDTSQQETYNSNIKQIQSLIEQKIRDDTKVGLLIKSGIINSGKYISDISKEEFMQSVSYNSTVNALLENLSKIFMEYHGKIIIGKLPRDQGGGGFSEDELNKLQQESPWEFLNSAFNKFGISHRINKPTHNIVDYINNTIPPFKAELSLEDGTKINFDDLSSGEKILCALAITQYEGNNFPKVLLFDEIDASLHPSMIKNFLEVVNEVYLAKGCKVIMATHSPTTAAIVPEASLFEIKKDKNADKIAKISQSDAVNLLSEGIMTLEKGLRIFDEIFKQKLTIISEGKNRQHIKKACEILEPTLIKSINFYEHDADSGVADLKGLFEFIKNTKFDKKVIFIWDCDAKDKVGKLENTTHVYAFCLEKNEANTIARKGIENLFHEDFFPDELCKQDDKGNKFFWDGNKNKLLEHLLRNDELKTFVNFKPLLEEINTLVKDIDIN